VGNHTPTPWFSERDTEMTHKVRIYGGSKGTSRTLVANTAPYAEAVANAAFIVLAANCHDELVEALKAMLRAANGIAGSEAELLTVAALKKAENGGR